MVYDVCICLYVYLQKIPQSIHTHTHKTYNWSSLQPLIAMLWMILVNCPIFLLICTRVTHRFPASKVGGAETLSWMLVRNWDLPCRSKGRYWRTEADIEIVNQILDAKRGIYIWDEKTLSSIHPHELIYLQPGFWYRTYNPLDVAHFWGTEPMLLCDRQLFWGLSWRWMSWWVDGISLFGGGLDELTMILWSIFHLRQINDM